MAAASISAAISHATQLLGYGEMRGSHDQEQAVREVLGEGWAVQEQLST